MRRSGRVESEKIGCSIVPKSSLGAASKISQKKKSPVPRGADKGPPAAAAVIACRLVAGDGHMPLTPASARAPVSGCVCCPRFFGVSVTPNLKLSTSPVQHSLPRQRGIRIAASGDQSHLNVVSESDDQMKSRKKLKTSRHCRKGHHPVTYY